MSETFDPRDSMTITSLINDDYTVEMHGHSFLSNLLRAVDDHGPAYYAQVLAAFLPAAIELHRRLEVINNRKD